MSLRVKRVITRRDTSGNSVLAPRPDATLTRWPGADAGDAVIWSTAEVPTDVSDAGLSRGTRKVGATLHGGSVFRVTELGPGFESPMHRTLSTDYIVVIAGELDLVLESGKTLGLKPGDVAVQLGAAHAWRNPDPAVRCRFLACMVEAAPVVIDGRALKATPMWKMVAASIWAMVARKRQAPATSPLLAEPLCAAARRFVIGHDAAGHATVLSTDEVVIGSVEGADGAIWRAGNASAVVPNTELSARPSDPPTAPDAAVFRIAELGPGSATPMRRAATLDYAFVLSGRLEVQLEGGGAASLGAGEALVQRATNQAWRNLDPEVPCRVALIQIAAALS